MNNNIKNKQLKLCYPIDNVFCNVISHITNMKEDQHNFPDHIFYFNNNNFIAEYNKKTGYFWCDYVIFWPKFQFNFTFDTIIIRCIFNELLGKYFKLNKIITIELVSFYDKLIEEHFKSKTFIL